MSSKSKRRGYAVEIWIRDKLNEAGVPCERVPLSGSMGGKYSGDLAVPAVDPREFSIEAKARRNGAGFAVLSRWLLGRDILVMKENNKDPIVAMPFEVFLKIMGKYYGTRIS